jgi:oxygen-independent coproporphyrinogen-3 oxidase
MPETDYVTALLADLEQDLPSIWGRTVRSIFIGGGTPSVLSPEAIYHLLSGVRARLAIVANAEITLEANPGTVDGTRFCGFREAGINRLSLGIQSFNDATLQHLGRTHGRKDAIVAIEIARQVGFDNINLVVAIVFIVIALSLMKLQNAPSMESCQRLFRPFRRFWFQSY